MDDALKILLMVVGGLVELGLLIWALVIGAREARKRREGLVALTGELGWSLRLENDPTHDDRYAQFGVFRRGDTRRAYNTMEGTYEICGAACDCRMGDFKYTQTTGSGKNRRRTTHHFSYLIVHTPWATVPTLTIRKEHLFDKMAGALGFDDIDFESSEFSKKFFVKSSNKRFAYDAITPAMMEFLLEHYGDPVHIELGCFLITSGSGKWDAGGFRRRLAWAEKFFGLWPEHLRNALGRGEV